MRLSRYFLNTSRQAPASAEIASHRLLLRAGYIRQSSAGIYTWLPLGRRSLRKAEEIVREEMDAAGGVELMMPMVQSADLWRESGRWDRYGPELLRFADRHGRDFCLGPTHEELITELARETIDSHRQLPLLLYQIQTKFRDEVRPRFGVMRAREFLMKDAYSFHIDETSLAETYERMREAYERVFTRMGLEFRTVVADSGSIGGSDSEEFHALADSGEDAIVFSDDGDYAANLEMAPTRAAGEAPAPEAEMEEVDTGDLASVEDVAAHLKLKPENVLKTLLVEGADGGAVALALAGHHRLNEVKAAALAEVASPLQPLSPQRLAELGLAAGNIGPVGLSDVAVVADHAALALGDFVCGANRAGRHYRGVNWQRDCPRPTAADLRDITEGEPSPDGRGRVVIRRGIEVGHIFKLGRQYSEAMRVSLQGPDAQRLTPHMGCYGIGVGRSLAAFIEQNHDDKGIVWNEALAPFHVGVAALNMRKSQAVRDAAEDCYRRLSQMGVDVLLDDRHERPGVKLADMELIGLPRLIVIGERGLAENKVEYRLRREGSEASLGLDEALARCRDLVGG